MADSSPSSRKNVTLRYNLYQHATSRMLMSRQQQLLKADFQDWDVQVGMAVSHTVSFRSSLVLPGGRKKNRLLSQIQKNRLD
eukprot:scaffold98129_cov53-Attheya_sp.AAC.2